MTRLGFLKSSAAIAALSALPPASAAATGAKKGEIRCEGVYPLHLQGVATDGKNIFWTFTTVLVKTDLFGKVLATSEAKWHMGDLCCRDGKVYVGVNKGKIGGCRIGDEVWVYDAADLKFLEKHPTPEAVWCNNGVEYFAGSFWVITDAPKHCRYNLLFRYSLDFKFMNCLMVDSGWTNLGVQAIFLHGDKILLGCYGNPNDADAPHKSCTLVVDTKAILDSECRGQCSAVVPCERRVEISTAEGMLELGGELMAGQSVRLSAKADKHTQRWSARLVPVKL